MCPGAQRGCGGRTPSPLGQGGTGTVFSVFPALQLLVIPLHGWFFEKHVGHRPVAHVLPIRNGSVDRLGAGRENYSVWLTGGTA